MYLGPNDHMLIGLGFTIIKYSTLLNFNFKKLSKKIAKNKKKLKIIIKLKKLDSTQFLA